MLKKPLVISFMLSAMLIYFTYHMFAGNRGLFSYFGYENIIAEKEGILDSLNSEQIALENKVHMLYAESIDIDFLDELARSKLGLIAEDEECMLNYSSSTSIAKPE
ncbi:FtsB family cell division protein [Candidatus Lariskella endosymbiont of Hedychridium roseum]|uniref:FtsB family cell division protein n=2 Tax=unclassified Candidatus Lariskella TaxID=2632605 RepID=UPI0030D28AA5